jgi:histidinol-phosphate aminotransferase
MFRKFTIKKVAFSSFVQLPSGDTDLRRYDGFYLIFGFRFNKNTSMNIKNLIRQNIKNLAPYASARHEFTGEASVFLDANENPFDTGFNRYPDPLQHAVKERISKIKKIGTEHIFLGNGSDEAIDLLMRIFCEPRVDEIMILPPTYGMYQVSASISDIGIKTVELTHDFQPYVDAILAISDEKTKILFLCSPNNPTANSFELETMEHLVKHFKGIVVIDEAYIDFAAQESCMNWIGKYPNLVILQTFSKAWGLAGIRLGMAFASIEIIDLLNKVKPPYNINQLTQQVALQSLENQGQTQTYIKEILKERLLLKNELEALKMVLKTYPTDANFILAKFENPRKVYDFLATKGVVVRDRSKVVLCDDCLRITVGTKAENELLLRELKNFRHRFS